MSIVSKISATIAGLIVGIAGFLTLTLGSGTAVADTDWNSPEPNPAAVADCDWNVPVPC